MGMLPECPWCHDAFHLWEWSCWPAPSSTPEPPCCVRCHDFGAVQWDDLTDAELEELGRGTVHAREAQAARHYLAERHQAKRHGP